ncbi:hypothetical protein ACE939_00775 [Aquimarina sp. W85]|uniref:RipA family octameric membrane protein n=1 Tax=Aquimarina rhodophyticola TaxID=3342246 RepID=UPI00366D645B
MQHKDKFQSKIEDINDEYEINLYKEVLELRKFEIENFWKRTLFFWGTIALIYAGYVKAELQEYKIIVPLIGVLFNIIFSLSIRGSKYWQVHWENMAIIYEKGLKFKLFQNDTKKITSTNYKSKLTKPYHFSVSKLTMLLSDLSVLLWFILWIHEVYILISLRKLKFDFLAEVTTFHAFTFSIIIIHVILIGYFILFLNNGDVYHKFDKGKIK